MNRAYIAIDLKAFYASVECVARQLDPLSTFLVVADASRTEKTICLAVSPALKKLGISSRARLFEVVERVGEINHQRRRQAPGGVLRGEATDSAVLAANPDMALGYIIAPPQMARYMEVSTKIYDIYLRYVAPEDVHVYSIDEVFIDVTCYLRTYGLTARELAMKMICDVLEETGITATAGVGTNMYLCKVAMDIMAKRSEPDANGVRIAELDEMSYRRELWDHRPLTDFWRVGRGYARKLERNGLYTMGDIARCSVGEGWSHHNEALLYKLFGVNAELLIDHAWGWESCTMADVKAYKPSDNSLSTGQVLHEPYTWAKARVIVQEMAELLALDLVDKGLVTDQIILGIGYDMENLRDPVLARRYAGEAAADFYGRLVPKPAHGSVHLQRGVSSARRIMEAAVSIFDQVTDPALTVRRVNITAAHVIPEKDAAAPAFDQLDMFTDYEALARRQAEEDEALAREKRLQQAQLHIKRKFGKNAILKGMNLQEGATTIMRNQQIGGHKA